MDHVLASRDVQGSPLTSPHVATAPTSPRPLPGPTFPSDTVLEDLRPSATDRVYLPPVETPPGPTCPLAMRDEETSEHRTPLTLFTTSSLCEVRELAKENNALTINANFDATPKAPREGNRDMVPSNQDAITAGYVRKCIYALPKIKLNNFAVWYKIVLRDYSLITKTVSGMMHGLCSGMLYSFIETSLFELGIEGTRLIQYLERNECGSDGERALRLLKSELMGVEGYEAAQAIRNISKVFKAKSQSHHGPKGRLGFLQVREFIDQIEMYAGRAGPMHANDEMLVGELATALSEHPAIQISGLVNAFMLCETSPMILLAQLRKRIKSELSRYDDAVKPETTRELAHLTHDKGGLPAEQIDAIVKRVMGMSRDERMGLKCAVCRRSRHDESTCYQRFPELAAPIRQAMLNAMAARERQQPSEGANAALTVSLDDAFYMTTSEAYEHEHDNGGETIEHEQCHLDWDGEEDPSESMPARKHWWPASISEWPASINALTLDTTTTSSSASRR